MRIHERWSLKLVLVIAATAGLFGSGCAKSGPTEGEIAATARYAGSTSCAECHEEQYAAWQRSLHHLAMQESDQHVVLGDFTGVSAAFGREGAASFFTEGPTLLVAMTEPGQPSSRHPSRYVLGREQIEQHLVEAGGGRLQALPVGYDTQQGDWFDIFDGDPRQPGNWGHWRSRGMTANAECLFCHTTGYQRGYRREDDTYTTTWAEMGVGCEACHGPGREHTRQASVGLVASVYGQFSDPRFLDACASCHSLRRKVWDGHHAGEAFLDHFDPVLPDEAAYGPDGSLVGEAYEWTSFLQSRMHGENVACFDCHDPHSGDLRQTGSALCVSCHDARYGTAAHTHHEHRPAAPTCMDCHMPKRVFMARDVRRDHSFSRPDPALSAELQLPDPCTDCHRDASPQWAASKVEHWFPDDDVREARRTVARAFERARRGDPDAVGALIDCLGTCADGVRRAAAGRLLGQFVQSETVQAALVRFAGDPDPLVRSGVVAALAEDAGRTLPARAALQRAAADPIRTVRLHAAWGLRGMLLDGARPEIATPVATAFEEWKASQLVEAEDPESHHALGLFYTAQEDLEAAVASYRTAIRLEPAALPSRHNLGVLLASLGRAEEALPHLEFVTERSPTLADANFALGTVYAHLKRWREAIAAFAQCLRSDPLFPNALHQLTLAYVGFGEPGAAAAVLEAALQHDRSKLDAMLSFIELSLETNDPATARRWAEVAVREFPSVATLPRVTQALSDTAVP